MLIIKVSTHKGYCPPSIEDPYIEAIHIRNDISDVKHQRANRNMNDATCLSSRYWRSNINTMTYHKSFPAMRTPPMPIIISTLPTASLTALYFCRS
jgi:hypothetical protein